jgi:asparagine synthase (glutamine-hydrolysing)
MCGICGFIDYKSGSSKDILDKMVATLHHRGPDDRGVELFMSDNAFVGLGQTRLSIIDISPAGHQPMNYAHLSIVLNGEIYNYDEIKAELKKLGHKFISGSDTEVVLHSFSEWGIKCISRFIGMFAFVILNKKTLEVTFVRDRAGVKPLYYYHDNKLFLFGSELKAFCEHPQFQKELDMQGVGYFFKMGYIPSPYSIYKNTRKLDPGHYATLNLKTNDFEIEKYWDVNSVYRQNQLDITYDEAKYELEILLKSAFNYRMVADVPVGVFLSGGYDSTCVTAILQKDSIQKIKTFTIGFEEGNNEAPFSREISKYLGTEHTEYICTTKEAQDTIPLLPFFYDEPFADSSAIPTMLVSKIARSQVTVALSADSGDELFAGYNSHILFNKNIKIIEALKIFNTNISAHLIGSISNFVAKNSHLRSKLSFINSLLLAEKNIRASLLREGMLSMYPDIFQRIMLNLTYPSDLFTVDSSHFRDPLSVALAIDYKCYLQNDILTKVDRASMSVSLEGREPLVDHRLLEFAARLPIEYKYDGITTKRIFKDIVHKYVPHEMMNRPKSGFTLPIYTWLRNDLSYMMDDHLSKIALNKPGIFNFKQIDSIINQFRKNKLYDESIIWKILQFQMWYNRWMH